MKPALVFLAQQYVTGEDPWRQPCTRPGAEEVADVRACSGRSRPDERNINHQLSGQDVDLKNYIGQRVEVFGTVRAEEQIASKGADVVDKPAEGTTGTPTIEITTELNVKQMTVSSVKPSGQRCEE